MPHRPGSNFSHVTSSLDGHSASVRDGSIQFSEYQQPSGWSSYPPPAHTREYHSPEKRPIHEANDEPERRLKLDLANGVAPSESTFAAKPDLQSPETKSVTSESSGASHIIPGREPLKKRKKHLDVLRRNRCELPVQRQDSSGEPQSGMYQVSPASSGSSFNHDQSFVEDRRPLQASPSTHATTVEPYFTRETQALNESAKIHDTAEIAPIQADVSSHPVLSGFPRILHEALSAMKGNALQWLSKGHAWRVVRWDLLHRDLFPKFFPVLCGDGESNDMAGSIATFLWNVRTWGFEELQDGPDAGAFIHKSFIRDMPDLCMQMSHPSLSPTEKSTKSSPQNGELHKTHSPKTKSLLRVPSLATTTSDGSGAALRSGSPHEPYDQVHWRHSYNYVDYAAEQSKIDYYKAGHHVGHDYSAPYQGHYSITDQSSYHYESPPSPFSKYPFRTYSGVGQKEVPPIKSGRGGSRSGASATTRPQDSLLEIHRERQSFPISKRGKGRGLRSCRTSIIHSTQHEEPSVASGISDDGGKVAKPEESKVRTPRGQTKKTLFLSRSAAEEMGSFSEV